MLFSLTQYIYITKENASQKIELAKKAVEGEEDNDSDEIDYDTDLDDFLNSDFNFICTTLLNTSNQFLNSKRVHKYHIIGINTPPPELFFA